MIKKISFILFVVGAMLFSSCADEDLSPIITFDKAGKGAYVRLVNLVSGEYDLNNVSTTKFEYDVEFVDVNKGKEVQTFDIQVTYVSASGTSDGPKAYKTFDAGEFITTENGFQGIKVIIPLSEMLSLFEISESDLAAQDQFQFQSFVTTKEGSKFGFANSTSAVNGPAFKGFFNFVSNVTCPLDNESFVGDYAITYDEFDGGGFSSSFAEGTVTLSLVPGSTTQRVFTANYAVTGSDYNLNIVFVCTNLTLTTQDSGLSCGGPNIVFKTGAATPFDINDDSEFTLEFLEDGGACGFSDQRRVFHFVKQ